MGNPIGNPTFPGANLAGGKNWVGFLTADYNATLTLTWDYAFNCATVANDLVPSCGPGVRTLEDQVRAFEATAAAAASAAPALFLIWFGINDVDRPLEWRGQNHTALHAATVARYFELVERLYDLGARNLVFLNVPAIERAPRVRQHPLARQRLEKAMYEDFNDRLLEGVERFGREYGDAVPVLVDTVPLFNHVLDNPGDFGADDEFCYGGYDDGCIWADDFHPGRALHEYLARNVVETLNGTIDGFFDENWSTTRSRN